MRDVLNTYIYMYSDQLVRTQKETDHPYSHLEIKESTNS